MQEYCSKCYATLLPNKWLGLETEIGKRYFCINCIKTAEGTLKMKMYINKDERALLKKMRKFLKKNGEYESN